MTEPEAKEAAKVLKAKVGKNWKIKVWKNLGWHYCVYRLPVSIYENIHGDKFSWTVFIGAEVGIARPVFIGDSAESPRAAVQAALSNAEADLSEQTADYEAASMIWTKMEGG